MSNRIPMPIPFGWFQVAYSHELTSDESVPLRYFDTDLVMFRTESGEAKVLDAYCPHMGAHLGYGIRGKAGGGAEVKGDSVICPFHGWAYNGEGKCTDVPYATNLPPKVARCEEVIRPWHVRELNQCIFVWYHPDNIDPTFEPDVVPEAAADNDDWGSFKIKTWDIPTHTQEVGENAVDAAHFLYVHGTKDIPTPEDVVFDGIHRSGRFVSKLKTPKGDVNGVIANASTGPGQATVRFSGICDTVLMANLTPVDRENSKAFYAFIQKKVDGKEPVGGVADAIVADIHKQMEEDIIIWERKQYFEKPLLCDNDGPFAKFRKWYAQFYTEDF
ncbi:Rieske 2Fe-2S domain-containing protein [Parahaliea sp. F7430]|uniref:Rieske 2Fe-2S domain-containing protein n=1 Tax=Sediminihaliea albiluteola TaxID=2758564 RepID=A0A7W2TTY0_9GAMM|nr:Rieske 2Fe-2S domain-containing protein [Sediminihaliea albiluteola]MBA6411912.1 Rieske 2Fe-2S domain-containing protein [Sediminihaliea albiluteola]